jgi:hypothetical protein
MVGVNFNTATVAVAGECITWAEDEIRKYLSRRYDMSSAAFQTSTSTPPIVKSWATRLSIGYTEIQLARGGKEAIALGESKVDSVLKNLELVAEGILSVSDSTGSLLTESDNSAFKVQSSTSGYKETFDVDDPLDWEIDSTRLEDIKGDRD